MKKLIFILALIVVGTSASAQKFAKRPKANDLPKTKEDLMHVFHIFPQDNAEYVWKHAKKGVLTELPSTLYEVLVPVDSTGRLAFVDSELHQPRRQDSVLYFTTADGETIIFKNLTTKLFCRPVLIEESERQFSGNFIPAQPRAQPQPQPRVVHTQPQPQARPVFRDDVYGYDSGYSSRIIIPRWR